MNMLRNTPRYAVVLILCAVFLAPFLIMITTSLKTMEDAFTIPVQIFPREITFENYPAAMERIPYFQYMGNTLFITICCLIGQLIVSPMVAYSLAKINWKGVGIISALIMATMMIPYTVTMIPLYKIWKGLNLASTYAPLIVPAFCGSSFYIIILRQFFKGIPKSLMEAAKIDGANEFQRYIRIALPLSKPALTTVAIYTFIASWSDYLAPMIYISEKSKLTLSLGLQAFLSEFNIEWTSLMAAAAVFVLPVVLMFLVFQRNFVEGIATTGIKS